MQVDKEKFLALSLSMTLGGTMSTFSYGCQKKSSLPDMGIANPQITPEMEGAIAPYEEYYSSLSHENPYSSCAPVWEGTVDSFMYSYSLYDECYVRCFMGDQTQCYTPDYECVTSDPTGECVAWEEQMFPAFPRQGTCSFWEVLPSANPDLPTIECVDYHQ